MVDISRINPSPIFQPNQADSALVKEISELALEKGVNLAQLIVKTHDLVEEASSELALTKGVNLGQLVATTYGSVEEASQAKAHAKIDELEKNEKKLRAVTEFLSEIENQLTKDKKVDMGDEKHKVVVDQLREMLDHKLPLLENNYSWSKDDAETLKTGLTRHSQIIMQQVHHSSSEVSRAIEEGTELLQIARKLLEMIDRHYNTLTSNQRGR
jgi:archaellum component FlaC